MRTLKLVIAAMFFFWGAPVPAQTTLPVSSADWIVQGDAMERVGGGASAGDVDGDGYDDVLVPSVNRLTNLGRILFYRGSSNGLSTSPAWTLEGSSVGAPLGRPYPAGDVNGDGFDDLILRYVLVSLPHSANFTLYLGSAAGPVPSSWTVSGWLNRTGDINGDGFDDLAVLADRDVLIFYGSAVGLSPAPGTTLSVDSILTYPLIDADFEDLNGDGYDDFALTWRYCAKDCFYTIAELSVYLGSSGGLATQPKRRLSFKLKYESLFPHVTSAGDVDADGFGDLAIPVTPDLASGRGVDELYWLPGSASGLGTPPKLVESSFPDTYSDNVNGAGDINGDGFADLLVPGGAELRVYTGGPGGYSAAPALIIEPGPGDSEIGAANAGAGDVNGDGLDDFIISSGFYDGQQVVGRVYLFLGRTTF